jgi:adenosine kinase
VGCAVASLVVETTGTQEYLLEREVFLGRLSDNYGAAAADEIDSALSLA